MTLPAKIVSVATAVPPHRVEQSEVRAFARGFFAQDFPNLERLLPAFDNTGIERRYLARPIEWYSQPRSFPEKNAVYCDVALELAVEAAEAAFAGCSVRREEIGTVMFVSTTGIRAPSLDGSLIQRLGLARTTARVPLWGLGCGGGAAGLARAAEFVRGTGRHVLMVAVELCSTTFVHGDRSKSNLIATALFGDGAAAAILGPGEQGMTVLGARSLLLDDTEDVMGWALHHEGLQVRFAKSIPSIVHEIVPAFVRELAAMHGAEPGDLHDFIVHPGGAKVLQAYEQSLGLADGTLSASRRVLADYGNMSSVTVLFVLERVLSRSSPQGRLGVLLGLGPGFCAEGVLVRW